MLGEDGEKASLLIFKLSRLLRYQLYESERQQVLLGDDIDFMTDYMKLEKLCNPEFNFLPFHSLHIQLSESHILSQA